MNISNVILDKEYNKQDLQCYIETIMKALTKNYRYYSAQIEAIINFGVSSRKKLTDIAMDDVYTALITEDLWIKRSNIDVKILVVDSPVYNPFSQVYTNIRTHPVENEVGDYKIKIKVTIETKYYEIFVAFDGKKDNMEVKVNEK